jgi:DNA replication protein DnaC
VVGDYVRYDEEVRNRLKRLKQRIIDGLQLPTGQESYLIWGPPGSGKSFLPQELARYLGNSVCYRELNMNEPNKDLKEKRFQEVLEKLKKTDAQPLLLFIDEIDSKPTPRPQNLGSISKQEELYSYQTWLLQLEPKTPRKFRACFIVAGSTGSDKEKMRELMISYDEKAKDLLDRIPPWNRETIPLMGIEDKIAIALSNLMAEARKRHLKVREVDKLALLYIALTPDLSSARNVREKMVNAINRLHEGENQIHYRYFFTDDEEMLQFWKKWENEDLRGQFVIIVDDGDLERFAISLEPFMPIAQKIEENCKFPTKDDFDKDLVYFDEEATKEIETMLKSENGRCCLLYGSSSSRKTTFSICFGSYLATKKNYQVFYWEVERDEKAHWKELAERISRSYDTEDILFIIDECHNSPGIIGRFMNKIRTHTKKAQFLFISRHVSEDRFDLPEHNYFDRLKSKVAWRDMSRAFEGVINQYCSSVKIGKEQVGNSARLIETCGGKLSVLDYLLRNVWQSSKEILSEIPRDRIYAKIRKDFLGTIPRTEILTKLSVIYEFEGTPIPLEGINALGLDSSSAIFEELDKEGRVCRRYPKTGGRLYFTICDDPVFAELILETADHFGLLKLSFPQFETIEEFILEILKTYLCKVKRHTLLLLSSIYESEKREIGEKLLSADEVVSAMGDYFVLIRSLYMLGRFMTLLRKFKIKKSAERMILSRYSNEALQEWTKNILENKRVMENPGKIRIFLELLRKFRIKQNDNDAILAKLSEETMGKWAGDFAKKGNIPSFVFFLKELRSFSCTKALEFLELVDPRELAKIFKQWMAKPGRTINTSLLTGTVIRSRRISPEFSKEFLDQFAKIELLDMLEGSKRELEKGKCNQIYQFVRGCFFSQKARDAYTTFLNRHSIDLIPFLTKLDLVHDGMFIKVSYYHTLVQSIYGQFFKYFLPDKLRQSSLGDITRFILQISEIRYCQQSVGVELARRVVALFAQLQEEGTEIVDGRLEEAVFRSVNVKLEDASLENIQNLISIVDEFGTYDFLSYIETELADPGFELGEKIEQSYLTNLGFLMWNVSQNQSLSRKFQSVIEDVRPQLAEKIRESSLAELTILAWNLFLSGFEYDGFFADIFVEALSRKNEKLGERLSLLALSVLINAKLVEPIEYFQIQSSTADYQSELEVWLNRALKNWLAKHRLGQPRRGLQYLVVFLSALEGFRRIDEKNCLSFLQANPDFAELKESLREFKTKNQRLSALVEKSRDWFMCKETSE